MVRLPKWLVVVFALVVLLGVAAPAIAAEAKGEIKTVGTDQFVMTDSNGKDWTFQLDKDAKVRLGDKDIKLATLKKGDKVEVTYEKKDGKLIATEIRCKRD